MNWTKDIPQKSGYYWCKRQLINEEDISIAHVCVEFGGYDITFTGSDMGVSLDDVKGAEWCGPIKPPSLL